MTSRLDSELLPRALMYAPKEPKMQFTSDGIFVGTQFIEAHHICAWATEHAHMLNLSRLDRAVTMGMHRISDELEPAAAPVIKAVDAMHAGRPE